MCAWIRNLLHVDPDQLEPEEFAERWREAEYLIKTIKPARDSESEIEDFLRAIGRRRTGTPT